MKRISLLVGVLVLGLALQAQKISPAQEQMLKNMESFLTFSTKKWMGKDFPDFVAVDKDGKTVTKQSLKGKMVYLNFWFATCPPCRSEVKGLTALQKKYQDSVVFLSITYESLDAIRVFATNEKFNFNHLHMRQTAIDSLQIVNAYPTNVLLDKNGKIVVATSGGYVDEAMNTLYLQRKFGRAIDRKPN
jgi:thiol-disulfide isomerase/thioredoxin